MVFRDDWRSHISVRVKAAANSLADVAANLAIHIDEQEKASNNSTPGSFMDVTGTVSPSIPDGKSKGEIFWERIKEFWEKYRKWLTADFKPVDPNILQTDSFDPNDNAQGRIGDCGLVAALNALMRTDAGDEILRSGIVWDEAQQGYVVTLYRDGVPVPVLVTEVIDRISGGGGGVGDVVALYEAAILKEFGPDVLEGTGSDIFFRMVTGRDTYTQWDGGNSDGVVDDVKHLGGSSGDHAVVAATEYDYPGGKDRYSASVTWDPPPTNGDTPAEIEIFACHAYEVVDARDGRIGLYNPHGGGGVFWISEQDFENAFDWVSGIDKT
jgi:hypothetical protein